MKASRTISRHRNSPMRLCRWVGAIALAVALGSSQAEQPTPRAVLVQPSGPEVPANLLRLSIRFAAQVEGPLLPRLSLLRADGRQVEAPFLEQELWSPSGKILTVMMHPGRVKTGLKAHDEEGPILSAGDDVALALDGVPIKRWRVGPADEIGPMASEWKVSAVRADSRQPLVVALDGPIDGRDADYLAIADVRGRRVAGRARLTNGESTWTFTPSAPWRPGAYKLVVRGTLEDPAGNRLNSHFENSIYSPPGPPVDAVVPFTVGSSRHPANTAVSQRNQILSPSFEGKAALEFFETSGRNLLSADAAAGVRHHVALSVVGTDRLLESGYFRGKMVQERLIMAAGIPYTTVHSTQFFEFLGSIAQFRPDEGDGCQLAGAYDYKERQYGYEQGTPANSHRFLRPTGSRSLY